MNFQPIVLNQDFRQILSDLDHSDANYFITGRAGTGKSTLLDLIKRTNKKTLAVLAPTGIAALNVGGQTIHSFFGFAPYIEDFTSIKKVAKFKMYAALELLIIDEVSMIRADLFDRMNIFLQKNRKSNLPFGGVQILLFGDLLQLPPVVTQEDAIVLKKMGYESPYFFEAKVFKQGFHMQMIELTNVFRQKERAFIKLLDRIRNAQIDEDDLDLLNQRFFPNALYSTDNTITLTTRNAKADLINKSKLLQIDSPAFRYIGSVNGAFSQNNLPADQLLELKVGAQVMFIRNDPNKDYVNGSIGIIYECLADSIKIEIPSSSDTTKIIEVFPYEWQNIKYIMNESKDDDQKIDIEIVGTYRQLPIKLAWAITIHKSQGKTFDRVFIDLDKGSFAHGQTYVALSRCRYLDGIFLSRPIKATDIFVDEKIVDYYQMSLL